LDILKRGRPTDYSTKWRTLPLHESLQRQEKRGRGGIHGELKGESRTMRSFAIS